VKRRPFVPALAVAALAAVVGLLALVLPALVVSGSPDKSLDILRKQKSLIQKAYAVIGRDQEQALDRLTRGLFPKTAQDQYALFKSLNLDIETEGVALYGPDKKILLWLGRVVDLEPLISGSPPALTPSFRPKQVLVRDRASSVLSLIVRLESGAVLVLHRLLAFIPEFRSANLDEYGFLSTRLRRNATVDFWDFRESLFEYERLFSSDRDEFLGTPRWPENAPSILFPLRTAEGRIIATVNLRSPSAFAHRRALREALVFSALSALALAILLFLIGGIAGSPSFRNRHPAAAVFFPGLIAFRAVFFPLSRLGPASSSPLFSPDQAGFMSWGDLTRSPMEILLTALCLFALSAGLTHFLSGRFKGPAFGRIALILPPLLVAGCVRGIEKLTVHANVPLLRFEPTGPFLLLHAAILFLLAAALWPSIALFRTALKEGRNPAMRTVAFTVFSAFALILLRPAEAFSGAALAAGLGLAAVWSVPVLSRRKSAAAALAFFIGWAGIYGPIRTATDAKTQRLAAGILRDTIETRDSWARFLLEESLRTLDRSRRDILAYLDGSFELPDAARRLWNETLAARFRWYSSLEIHDAEGTLLSRFALNVPKIFRPSGDLPFRAQGNIVRRALPFMGKEKDFLIGYKDWEAEGKSLGRTIIYLSLDDDMLPFLYSANPYFELLRSNSLPSLVQFDFRLAIFDSSGRLVFNPGKLSSGLPPGLLESKDLDGPGIRTDFRDKNELFDLFAFRSDGRVYAILTPRPGVIGRAVEYLKSIFLAGLLLAPIGLAAAWMAVRRTRLRPLWSFADRVYVSFAVVALIPLLLFAVFSRGFFNRVFTQQFVRKAEIHANLARNVMADLAALQEEDKAPVETPPDDLVLWISSTIANDVNLYRDGRLASSSRRELFDDGLLPELLDGEIHYQIQFADHPYYAQTSRLGSFSFRTLTVPYNAIAPSLLLSLPFPFERQEISAAGRELFEFLVFIGIFFVGTVLVLARGIGAMIVTPVRRLLAGTREAALGNLEFEVEYRGRDEMKTLVDGFNAMIRNLKSHQQEMADLGRKAAWAEMARKVAHEVKNPLTPIQLSAEHLLHVWKDRPDEFEPALKESISYIVGEVDNLRRIAEDFLDLSRAAVLNKAPMTLDEVLIETIAPYKKLLADRLVFHEAIDPDLAFDGDRAKLKIAFRNLMINAIESIRHHGEIRVEARRAEDQFLVVVVDNGSGMSPDVLDRIFEPHFSTKSAGTGLGLPITKKIIEDHGGTIRVRSEAGQGTTILIELPS